MNLAICSNRDLFIFEFVLLAGFIFQTLINDEFLKMSCFIKIIFLFSERCPCLPRNFIGTLLLSNQITVLNTNTVLAVLSKS